MLPGHQLAAAVLVRNELGQVLMIASPYRQDLVLPGGIVEPNESPAHAAAREVMEETGLKVEPTRLLVVEHLAVSSTGQPGVRFVFDAEPVSSTVRLHPQPEEVCALLWLSPADAVRQHVQRGRRRLSAALGALECPGVTYIDGSGTLE